MLSRQERTRVLERQNMLKELADEYSKEEQDYKIQQQQAQLERQNSALENIAR